MTDEKLRLQKHPGYRIYSPVPASGVRAMIERYEPYAKVFSSQGQRTSVEAVMQLHPTGSFVHFTVYETVAARLAEVETLLRGAYDEIIATLYSEGVLFGSDREIEAKLAAFYGVPRQTIPDPDRAADSASATDVSPSGS